MRTSPRSCITGHWPLGKSGAFGTWEHAAGVHGARGTSTWSAARPVGVDRATQIDATVVRWKRRAVARDSRDCKHETNEVVQCTRWSPASMRSWPRTLGILCGSLHTARAASSEWLTAATVSLPERDCILQGRHIPRIRHKVERLCRQGCGRSKGC